MGPRDLNWCTLYMYMQLSRITGLEYGLEQWNWLWNFQKKHLKPFFHSNSQLCCVAIYLITHPYLQLCLSLGLHSCIFLEVLGVKGHVHIHRVQCTPWIIHSMYYPHLYTTCNLNLLFLFHDVSHFNMSLNSWERVQGMKPDVLRLPSSCCWVNQNWLHASYMSTVLSFSLASSVPKS